MKIVWRSVKSNLYKMVHSHLLWIHILVPVATCAIFNIYFASVDRAEAENVSLYLQAIALAFPIMIAVVTTLLYEADRGAGQFQVISMLPTDKAKGHIGNLSALLLHGGITNLLAVVGFAILYRGIGVQFSENQNYLFPITFYIKASGIFFVINIIGYLIQYMLCYTFGRGISLVTGTTGTLLAALLYLGIGDLIWKWVPSSYGMRMISYYLIMNDEPSNGSSYLLQYATGEFHMGKKVIAAVLLLAVSLFIVWGNRWEAARVEEE